MCEYCIRIRAGVSIRVRVKDRVRTSNRVRGRVKLVNYSLIVTSTLVKTLTGYFAAKARAISTYKKTRIFIHHTK